MKLVIAFALFLTVSQAADSISAVAGHWKGQGELVNWTARHELAVDLLVTEEGAVSGTIGDAQIAWGRVERGHVVKVLLQGALLRDDSVVRKEFQLRLSPLALQTSPGSARATAISHGLARAGLRGCEAPKCK
jgi:hypothetical protein